MKWRGIGLMYANDVQLSALSTVLGASERSLTKRAQVKRPQNVCLLVQEYVKDHVCFYFKELSAELAQQFDMHRNVSDATIYRALQFD
ncbi:hypothetical protein GN958_ATG07666 [Phytophthora infestans]|uniref:Uncharacterized protein n=1 Tax=Phytophthora infestans TaxID=4787 RepID=A0A8S9UFY0_PHYIN|nr:hypothetical protein GN958_ATG10847 [Phytophthora infestans]KAF4143136.1 hypothetical protein GN958_ATG07666 [Phytophthora infestans]